MVVEDQTAIRQMLVAYVETMADFEVVGEAGDVAEAVTLAAQCRPRIVILGWLLTDGIGLDFLRAVRLNPPPHVLVFSSVVTDLSVREALAAGAVGYLEKSASVAEFMRALKAVAAGQTYLGERARRVLLRNPRQSAAVSELSVREREVLRQLAGGLTSKEIASRLSLSVRTVDNHRSSITRRTGLRSVAELTLHAVRLGLVEAPPSNPTTTTVDAAS